MLEVVDPSLGLSGTQRDVLFQTLGGSWRNHSDLNVNDRPKPSPTVNIVSAR